MTGLVVIDEASMMTLEMLAGILHKVSPFAHVVLIGDPNQLLSVGAGNVLPDLLALGVPCTQLTICHRQSAQAAALGHNVRHFQECRSLADLRFDNTSHRLTRSTSVRQCAAEALSSTTWAAPRRSSPLSAVPESCLYQV